MNARRLLVVGLDAVESSTLHDMIEAGDMPNLAVIQAAGATAPIRTMCMDTLPGAIWQDILTGRCAGQHGDYYPVRIHTGEAEPRPIDPTLHGGTYVWDVLAKAGIPSVVIDPPLASTYPDISDLVTLVAEWHVHDSNYGRCSHPPELIAELETKHGARPVDRCDFLVDGSDSSYHDFIEHLEVEASIKTKVAVELLQERPWEFAFVGMSQGHCAGHQLWQFEDAAQRGADDRGLGHGVRAVYRALDRSIGELVATVGADVDVLTFTSHGMGNYVGGPQLIADVLRALDFGDARKVPSRLRPFVPSKAIHRVFDRFPQLLRKVDQAGAFRPVVDETITATTLGNNRCGAIRLNVKGREPNGAVEPADVDATLTSIEGALLSLQHPDSGEAIVSACHRADVFGPDRHPDLPDLMVAFRQDLGLLDSAASDQLGTIARPVWTKRAHRTGDHTDHSQLWAAIDGVEASRLSGLTSLDLAPLILRLMERPPTDQGGAA